MDTFLYPGCFPTCSFFVSVTAGEMYCPPLAGEIWLQGQKTAMDMSIQSGSIKRGHEGELRWQQGHKLGIIIMKWGNQLNFKEEAGSWVHCLATASPKQETFWSATAHWPMYQHPEDIPQKHTQKPQTTRGDKQDLGPAVTANLRRNASTDYSPCLLPKRKGRLPNQIIPSGWRRRKRKVRSLPTAKAGNQPYQQPSAVLQHSPFIIPFSCCSQSLMPHEINKQTTKSIQSSQSLQATGCEHHNFCLKEVSA